MSDDPRWRNDEPRWPNDSPNWPERDLQAEADRNAWPDGSGGADYQPPPSDFPEYQPPRYDPPRDDPPRWDPPAFETADEASPPPAEQPTYAEEAPPADVALPVESGDPATAFNGTAWDPKLHGERRRPTTAEQAVPWLIGIILALAGIVIVLMALIFTAPDGLLASTSSPSPSEEASVPAVLPSSGPSGQAQASPSALPSASSQPTASPPPTATPAPEYGPLEMVYLGRPSAVAPVYLLRRDFSRRQDADVMAQADSGVSAYAWSPDGRVGAAIIGERLVALQPGKRPRPLADGISAVTFGLDSETVYAVRIRRSGANNAADVLAIGFRRGNEQRLGVARYPRPAVAADPPLREAQFIDDGGQIRLYATADGNLALWILGAPSAYHVDAEDGSVTEARRQPELWSPNGMHRVERREQPDGTTNLVLRDSSGESVAATQVPGLVSHIRWVSSNNEIVFTLGRTATNGGVLQDLYVWDLRDGRDAMPLTSNGVSFGAEWLGSFPHWLP